MIKNRIIDREIDHQNIAMTTGCMIIVTVIAFLVFFRLVANLPTFIKVASERITEIVTSTRPVIPLTSSTTSDPIEPIEEETDP